jgi:hypothetical protein
MCSYARYWLEAFRLPVMPAGRLIGGLHDTGHIRAAFEYPATGRGVVLALPHMGNYDLAGAWLFVDVIQPGNGIGLVRFDTVACPVNDPAYPGLAVTAIGAGGIFDPGRRAAAHVAVAWIRAGPGGGGARGRCGPVVAAPGGSDGCAARLWAAGADPHRSSAGDRRVLRLAGDVRHQVEGA